MRMKRGPRNILVGLVVAGSAFFGIPYAMNQGWIPGIQPKASLVPSAVNLPTAEPVKAPTAAQVPKAPVIAVNAAPAAVNAPQVTWYQMAWQSQTAANYANGGAVTAKGSLMEKHGVNLRIERQDDVAQMQAELIKAAQKIASGDANAGAVWVAIMGDGAAAFFAGVNPTLERIGTQYRAQGFYSPGFSRGEDKVLGPLAWRENPQMAKGGVVASYLRDGDWNIMIEWANANGIPVNPDPATWCPDALNNWGAKDFLHAVELYNTSAKEERPVVDLAGKRTGEKKTVAVNSVCTWTPGDVNVAEGPRGGLVSIVSTREYYWQMPCLVIGIQAWLEANPKTVEGFIEASCEAGDQLKVHPDVLKRATEINAALWKFEPYPGYWLKYFDVQKIRDSQGNVVECGGSAVNNLADNLHLFGLSEGSTDIYAQVYREFGDIVVEQYPELVPNYPPVEQVINKRFLRSVMAKAPVVTRPDLPEFVATAPIQQEVSRKAWAIEFESGKATFTTTAEAMLRDLLQEVSVTALSLQIDGHTDADGSVETNQTLSERRAFAVRGWLQSQDSNNFPDARFKAIRAYGESAPIASNDTPEGKAKNRRVEIALGTTG